MNSPSSQALKTGRPLGCVALSSVDVAVSALRSVEPEDVRVLRTIEKLMGRYEHVPVDAILRASGLPEREVGYRLDRLHALGLIRRWIGPYTGYVLRMAGHDLLALYSLVRADVLEAFGKPLGVGKEADVYDALTPDGRRVAVKFHRLGRTSFRQTRRLRGYTRPDLWSDWYVRSRVAAKRELRALKLAYAHGVSVPEPIARNRHVLVMGIIEGKELASVSELPEPDAVLAEVLENVRKAYVGAGIIHADLSEFNIVIRPDASVLIIDWPQFVYKSHPNARWLLGRDVRNVLRFFRRRFGLHISEEAAIGFVVGTRRDVPGLHLGGSSTT